MCITATVPDGVFKYFITKDPNWVLIDHDYYHPDQELYDMLMAASEEYDANSPEFDDFIANNGKLIYFAGWNDMSMSPWQLIQQYRGYVEKYGQEKCGFLLQILCDARCDPSEGHCNELPQLAGCLVLHRRISDRDALCDHERDRRPDADGGIPWLGEV